MSIINAIKAEIGFNKHRKICKLCKYRKRVDGHGDRCTYAGEFTFLVDLDDTCSKHEPRGQEK